MVAASWLQEMIWVTFLFLVLPNVFAQSGGERVASIVTALRQQDFQKALELLHTALDASPQDAQLWTMQGVAFEGEGNKDQALVSFRHALTLAPNNIPALQGVAELEYDAGDPA
jgi:Flp pilus assembly protein TadD